MYGNPTVVDANNLVSALQDIIPYLTITAEDNGNGTATVEIQIVDASGTALSTNCLVRTWTSGRAGADMGAPAAIVTEYSVTCGTEIYPYTAEGDYEVLSDGSGAIEMLAKDAQNGALYFMASIGGLVYSATATVTGT